VRLRDGEGRCRIPTLGGCSFRADAETDPINLPGYIGVGKQRRNQPRLWLSTVRAPVVGITWRDGEPAKLLHAGLAQALVDIIRPGSEPFLKCTHIINPISKVLVSDYLSKFLLETLAGEVDGHALLCENVDLCVSANSGQRFQVQVRKDAGKVRTG